MSATDETLRLAANELTRRGRLKLADALYEELGRPPLAIQVAQALRAARARSELTQKKAADLLCVPLSTYVSLEGGKHRPSATSMKLLAKLIKLDEVFSESWELVNSKVAKS